MTFSQPLACLAYYFTALSQLICYAYVKKPTKVGENAANKPLRAHNKVIVFSGCSKSAFAWNISN